MLVSKKQRERELLAAVAKCADDDPAYFTEGAERLVAARLSERGLLEAQRGDPHSFRITNEGRLELERGPEKLARRFRF